MGTKRKTPVKPRASARSAEVIGKASSLSDALFSGTQQRVLGLLFGQPERSYFATEIIKLARAGSGAVQRELERLETSGLVTVTQLGNQKHYQANQDAPVFAELRSIMLKTVGLAEPLRMALLPLTQQIRFAAVFGSVAKRTDTASSDIDLLVVADDLPLVELYRALAPAELHLARKVNPTLYTSEEFRRRRSNGDSFVSKVLRGEHIVLLGDEDATTAPR